MSWFDFSDLVTEHFAMKEHVNVRYFNFVSGLITLGVPAAPTWEELIFSEYSFVPRAPKNYYDQLPADKRERDTCLVWTADAALQRLKTVKRDGEKNAGRILDVDAGKWYLVKTEWFYGRQGNLNGVIGELIDGPPPDDLPPPPV